MQKRDLRSVIIGSLAVLSGAIYSVGYEITGEVWWLRLLNTLFVALGLALIWLGTREPNKKKEEHDE